MKDSDPLSERLQRWRVDPEIPSRFQADVWTRIRDRADARPATGLTAFLAWLVPAQPTWRYATAAIAVVLAVSTALGTVTAQRSNAETRTILATSYAASIDPYLRVAAPEPHR